jgi:hypothetical protein
MLREIVADDASNGISRVQLRVGDKGWKAVNDVCGG